SDWLPAASAKATVEASMLANSTPWVMKIAVASASVGEASSRCPANGLRYLSLRRSDAAVMLGSAIPAVAVVGETPSAAWVAPASTDREVRGGSVSLSVRNM